MTPAAIYAECRAIAKMVGVRAWVGATITSGSQGLVRAALYPKGVTKSEYIDAEADTFEEAFAELRRQWVAARATYEVDTVRKMALKIIQITDATGQCTDAGLRQHFDEADIKRFGATAVALADQMAAGAPFSILHVAQPNAA